MNVRKLIERLNVFGPFDVVLTSNFFASNGGYGKKGMKASVVRVNEDGLVIDYSKFKDYNLSFESPDYGGGKTATQIGEVPLTETIYITDDQDMDLDECEPIDKNANCIYQEFLDSGEERYVSFLEETIKDLRRKVGI